MRLNPKTFSPHFLWVRWMAFRNKTNRNTTSPLSTWGEYLLYTLIDGQGWGFCIPTIQSLMAQFASKNNDA